MAGKPRWEFRLRLGGKPLIGIMVKEIGGGGVIVKPTESQPNIPHLHVYPKDGTLHRHVTHEQYEDGRRHTQKRAVTVEEVVYPFLEAIAPDDDPPPPLSSFADERQFTCLVEWFGRILPRLFRPPREAPVRVLMGPLGDLMDRAISGAVNADWELDLTSYLVHELEGRPEEDLLEVRMETDLSMTGRRVAFSDDLSKFVVLLREGMVMELSFEALQRASDTLMETLGYAGYWRTLRRRGILSVIRERMLVGTTVEHSESPSPPS